MGEYQFEVSMTFTDIITIDADSYEEAYMNARSDAEDCYVVAPAGFSVPWDDVDVVLIDEPDEDEDD